MVSCVEMLGIEPSRQRLQGAPANLSYSSPRCPRPGWASSDAARPGISIWCSPVHLSIIKQVHPQVLLRTGARIRTLTEWVGATYACRYTTPICIQLSPEMQTARFGASRRAALMLSCRLSGRLQAGPLHARRRAGVEPGRFVDARCFQHVLIVRRHDHAEQAVFLTLACRHPGGRSRTPSRTLSTR
jgi:hypothetical protein